MKQYDLVVIGAGSGGLVAAEFSAKLGAHVLLVESKNELGGECLHSGCVPSKALIHQARLHWIQSHGNPTEVNFAKVKQSVVGSIDHIQQSHDNDAYYEKFGIDVLHGKATFSSKHTISVGETRIQARRFIIATGSSAAIPNVEGLKDADFLTNESVFELDTLPDSLIIIGGGPIGCELGQAFGMLGSKVTILQSADRVLPRESPSVSATLAASLSSMQISVVTDVKIQSIYTAGGSISVSYSAGGAEQSLSGSQLLIATGRKAVVPDGIETAGIKVNDHGIVVNDRMQTSNKHIYAVGDCNGGMQFTHAAAEQASIAVQNALLGLRRKFDPARVSWTTFTTPEISRLGKTHQELEKESIAHTVHTLAFKDIDKAVAERESGNIEILLDSKYKILGANVVGANSAEILSQLITIRELSVPFTELARPIQTYPTYALGLQQMASDLKLSSLQTGIRSKFVKMLIKLRLGA